MMTYCSQGNPDIDLVSLSMSNLSMNDNVLGRLVSCLQYCGRLSEIRLDHNMITVSGLEDTLFLNLAVAKSLQSTRMVTDDAAADDDDV